MKFFKMSFLFGLFALFGSANAADITLYYSPSCPHCHHARDFIENELIYEYDDLKVTMVNVFDNRDEFRAAIGKCKYNNGGVPVMVIGEKCFQGYGDSMQGDIRSAIEADLTDAQKQTAANNKKSFDKDKDDFVSSRSERKNAVTEIKKKQSDNQDLEIKEIANDDTMNIVLAGVIGLLLVFLGVLVLKKQK